MNNQMERPTGHTTHVDDPHMHGQDVDINGQNEEHHGEKKSVLKKVKAKAKKIKDTIKDHVGHGHDHHEEDDDEDDEMDMDPEIHGTHTAQSTMPGQEGVARQQMHEPIIGERTAGEGAHVMSKPRQQMHEPTFGERTAGEGAPHAMSKPGDYQTFDPTTARYTPGQDETLGWSRTDARRPQDFEEKPYAPKNTPVAMHSGGGHSASTGALDMGKKGAPVKLGGVVGGVERDPQAPKDVGVDRHPANYQAKVTDPTATGKDPLVAQSFMAGLHTSKIDERSVEGVINAPASKPHGDLRTFDLTTTDYVPGQEETLGWSRADTGRLNRSEEVSNASYNTPIAAHSGHESHDSTAAQRFMPGLHRRNMGEGTAVQGVVHSPTTKQQGHYQTFDPTSASYVPGQEETLGWSRTDTGRQHGSEKLSSAIKNTPTAAHSGNESHDPMAAQGFMGGPHRSKVDERTAMEGVIHSPESNPKGDYHTFDPNATSYFPGQEETLGWSRTDTGRTHTGRIHGMGAEEERGTGKLGGLIQNPGFLEKDPNTARVPGERHHAGNYETKVSDPTGKGGEEVGVTPILHQLDKMNIFDESQQKPRADNVHLNRTEHTPQSEKITTGSHNQFYPEPVTSETSTFLQQSTSPISEGPRDMSEQKQGSYTGKVSSAAAMVADKAKQATNSVTSKLGYGGNSDQHPTSVSSAMHDKSSEPRGYGEKITGATAAITNKAVQAKDVVASKLGYGGTHERQPPVQEGASKGGGSIVGTVKEKMAPVYDKGATVGSTMASKVQGSGTEHEVQFTGPTIGPTAGVDKGVSMKEYLVEKLKPGEEDKALSEAITAALPVHKRREDVSKSGEFGEGEARKVTIIGRVTESDEVAQRLGRSDEKNYDNAGTGMASPGKGVMDRIKEAATSWFQSSGEFPSQYTTTQGTEGSTIISSTESEQKRADEAGFQ
ncbi:low-temperature-induced 65 kDa protein [Spinacia oleracea]|uniref:Low-temperature-induced 65 kDa protein n=1 Tax=Spinacia oleracea TaxID=3562 RepID=A0A9R0I3Z9_SPIOL|nr:low-temperature-induced 65 kDa protein-like [Spinacia oleracea]